jgi:ribosomal protein L11 methyltransferase
MWIWSKLSSAKWRDAWEERLQLLADTSLVITEFPGKPTLRLEMYCQRKTDAERVKKQFGGVVRPLKKQNWAALATPQIEPIKIRDRFLVVSESDDDALARHRAAHPGRELLVIPVEMAFGTGDHPTTATCLRLLCDLPLAGQRVLDLGCGTGILALAAKKLGAGRVLAVDFDPEAVAASKRNAKRNSVRGVTFERRDVLAWTPDEPPFNLILANIFADVLTASFPKMRRLLAPGGTLILSGILNTSAPELLKEGVRCGFHFTHVIHRGKWVTAVAEAAPRER